MSLVHMVHYISTLHAGEGYRRYMKEEYKRLGDRMGWAMDHVDQAKLISSVPWPRRGSPRLPRTPLKLGSPGNHNHPLRPWTHLL